MNHFALAFLGGVFGALLMDITETIIAKFGISSGVSAALIGRWFLCLFNGQFFHSNILHTQPHRHEVKAGWAFHFLIGGGGVALLYPLAFAIAQWPLPEHFILGGVVFGLLTSLLPWLLLLPAFGWGMFGRRGPRYTNALLSSTLAHLPYGIGVGAIMAAALH